MKKTGGVVGTLLKLCFLAAIGGIAFISLGQSLPPFAGFGSGKQAIAAGEDEMSAEAKRAWLFLEYPQLSLVPEPPVHGTFHSLQKSSQPPLPFLPIEGLPIYSWAEGFYMYDDLDYRYPLRRSGNTVQRSGDIMEMSGPPALGDGGEGGGGDTNTVSSYTISHTTNELWIQLVPNLATNGNTTNYTLKVHNTLAGVYYEAMACTNLVVTNGWLVLGGVLATNDVSVLPDPVWPTNNAIQFFIARASGLDTDGDGLPDWWERANSLDPYSADSGSTGTIDGYKNLAGDGWSNLEKYQNGWNPNSFYTPAAPGNFQLVRQTNGFAQLFWDRAYGDVTGYVIERDTGSGFTTLATVAATEIGYLDTSAPVGIYRYRMHATHSSGSSAHTPVLSNPIDERMTVDAKIVRGPGGRLFLVAAALPPDAVSLLVSRQTFDAEYPQGDYYKSSGSTYDAGLTDGEFTVALSSLTNGIALLPTNAIPPFGHYALYVAAMGPDGRQGNWTPANEPPTVPFLDGTAAMKENLSFLLRAAGSLEPLQFRVKFADGSYSSLYRWPDDYVYSGCFDTWLYNSQNEFEPFEENRYFRNFAFPVNGMLSSGLLDSGITDVVATEIRIGLSPAHSFPTYSYVVNSNQAAIGSTLSRTNSLWIFGGYQTYGFHLDYGLYLNASNHLTLATGFENIYGLTIQSAQLKRLSTGTFFTLNAGDEVSFGVDGFVYHEVAEPVLETTGFYFARAGLDSIPGNYDFSVTNTTPLLLASVGQPMQLAGWAKQRIVNGYTNKFAYLGQYFDKAVTLTNGVKTTNQTGILSEYGDFLPTEPGAVILTTKTNLDQSTNQVGEALVHVISLNVDANHDGIMNRSIPGPDQTSVQKPFRFWVNNDFDGSGQYGEEQKGGRPDYSDLRGIASERDLEDFARLWISGLPSLKSSDGYRAILTWRNVTGAPALNIFRSIEGDGGTRYLTDTNFYSELSASEYRYSVGVVTTNFGFELPNDLLTNGLTKHFIFEAAGAGKGELVLTIEKSGTTIAEASIFVELMDVKDMFERALAVNVTDGLPPSAMESDYKLKFNSRPVPGESKQIIVFVHGLNNTDFDYENTSETMFKRLYWAAYQGRFAAFRWPCAYLPFEKTLNPYNYNKGEFYAWKSARAFKNYLSYLRNTPRLSGYQICVYAHSQGNAVASEAIAQGGPFDTYILTQGAIPAHCFDTNAPFLSKFLDKEEESGRRTPFSAAAGGYNGCFSGISGNLVSFFNTNDYALASGTYLTFQANWEENQLTQKPESFSEAGVSRIYRYDGTNSYMILNVTGSLATNIVTDVHEKRAVIARSRSKAVGAQGPAGGGNSLGNIGATVDLISLFGFGTTRSEHSAQFNRNVQSIRDYYLRIVDIVDTP